MFVGHSYGGDVIRLYAATHPTKVAGLVLDDALSEDLPKRLYTGAVHQPREAEQPWRHRGAHPGAEEFRF